MKPKSTPAQEPDGLFKTRLEHFIDMNHPLVKLGERLDWAGLDAAIGERFSEQGRPATPSRFMLGMLILKAVENLSDEMLWARWPRDPYYQYFTGELYFQHQVPHERSGLSHWRKRLGAAPLDALLQESLRLAHADGALRGKDMQVVSVDTTVQEKAVSFPTDAKLLYTAITKLGAQARAAGVKLRQSYKRVAKRAVIMAGRYAHAKQFKRRNKQIRFLKHRLGRIIRDVERKIEGEAELQERFKGALDKARTLKNQVLNKKAPRKLFSWHAPETECIGKGKARAPYEFGVKASITTTNARAKGGMFILHADALHGRPYDGHTLGRVLEQTKALTGVTPQRVHVDKGYKGHKQGQAKFNLKTRQEEKPPWRVFMAGRKKLKPHLMKEIKRRAAIEPVIGHMKADHRMGKNWLKGQSGDRFNVKMAAIGYNFKRILTWIQSLVLFLIVICTAKLKLTQNIAAC